MPPSLGKGKAAKRKRCLFDRRATELIGCEDVEASRGHPGAPSSFLSYATGSLSRDMKEGIGRSLGATLMREMTMRVCAAWISLASAVNLHATSSQFLRCAARSSA